MTICYTLLTVICITTNNFKSTFLTFVTTIFLIHFHGWIISHFYHIDIFDSVVGYSEDWPRACMYSLRRGNNVVQLFCVYINRIAHDDIIQIPYTAHHNTFAFDSISLNSG